MKNIRVQLLAFAFLCLASMGNAQGNEFLAAVRSWDPITQTGQITTTRDASFPNLNQYLSQTLVYPQDARENGIEGVVVAEAIIGADGSVLRTTLVHGLGFGCDETVLELIEKMPKWQPAMESGKVVGQSVYIQVRFKLR